MRNMLALFFAALMIGVANTVAAQAPAASATPATASTLTLSAKPGAGTIEVEPGKDLPCVEFNTVPAGLELKVADHGQDPARAGLLVQQGRCFPLTEGDHGLLRACFTSGGKCEPVVNIGRYEVKRKAAAGKPVPVGSGAGTAKRVRVVTSSGTTAAPRAVERKPDVEIVQSGDGGVTITVHRTGRDAAGKPQRVSTSTPVKVQKYKERSGRHEETFVVLTCKKWDGTPGASDYRCVEWNEERFSTPEEIQAAEARAKAHTDQAVAAVALPMFSRTRPGGEILSEQMLAQVICPVNKMTRGSDGIYRCTAERTELYSPATQLEAQQRQIDGLKREATVFRQSAVLQPTRQPYELMLGAGATGVMDLGGALVAVGDMVWGSDRWPLGLVLHGEVGDMSDGQGLFGCAEAGLVKPMPGTTTTVGMLGGWCGSKNADLDGTNFWHGTLQVRHRVLANWLALGADLKGGALWREKVVDQSVREVRDPAAGLTFVAQLDF